MPLAVVVATTGERLTNEIRDDLIAKYFSLCLVDCLVERRSIQAASRRELLVILAWN
jgi:hypothetical protein